MSRLIEKIKKQSETTAVQMGFRRALPENKHSSILLVAKVTVNETGAALKNIEGADAVLLDSANFELTAKTLAKIVKPLGETPWGIFLEESKDTAEALNESGCDFVIVTPASPIASAPKNEKIGKLIQVESSMDDGLLRALADLPVDAIVTTESFGESGTLAYHHLMILKYLALLVRKPLIVPVPATISKDELNALWDAGIGAVLVTVDVSKGENLKDLREIASNLPPRVVKKEKNMDVFLPRAGEAKAEPEPDEEEEEDE